MKKYLFIVIFLTLCSFSLALAQDIQFRLVLLHSEAKKGNFVEYPDPVMSNKRLYVGKEVLLSSADIEKIGIWKSLISNDFKATINFKDESKQKLFKVTKKYIRRQLAIIIGDKIFAAPMIMEPLSNGQAQLSSLTFTQPKQIEEFIKGIGYVPYLETKIKNKDEEADSYRYAKYAMEQNNQAIAEYTIRQLYEYNPKSELIQKLVEEYPGLEGVLPKK